MPSAKSAEPTIALVASCVAIQPESSHDLARLFTAARHACTAIGALALTRFASPTAPGRA
jgi:hypothetical protein